MSTHNLVGIYGIADDPAEVPKHSQWVARMRRRLEPVSVGLYVGEADLEVTPGRAAKCYSAEAWERMRELKRKHDPDDLFCWFLGDVSPNAVSSGAHSGG
jgi:hypothetical protein